MSKLIDFSGLDSVDEVTDIQISKCPLVSLNLKSTSFDRLQLSDCHNIKEIILGNGYYDASDLYIRNLSSLTKIQAKKDNQFDTVVISGDTKLTEPGCMSFGCTDLLLRDISIDFSKVANDLSCEKLAISGFCTLMGLSYLINLSEKGLTEIAINNAKETDVQLIEALQHVNSVITAGGTFRAKVMKLTQLLTDAGLESLL